MDAGRPGLKSRPKFMPFVKNPTIPKTIITKLMMAQGINPLLKFLTFIILSPNQYLPF